MSIHSPFASCHTILLKRGLHISRRPLDPLFGKEMFGTEANEVFCRRSVPVVSSSWEFLYFSWSSINSTT